jgi:RNA polymerase sigma factor (sigma-70 family)
LTENEKNIISKYYIEGVIQKDIAKELNISPVQVGRVIKRALNKMYKIMVKEAENSSKEVK